ncbi:hypothetical protein JK159_02380 [Weissella minor]|uniref:hypothetical protein n=1 Tax=Weissella minor TaxID=1620 RepID=UPI001BB0350C|nr:hypothetical protein [Weissella minor]MBS0949230.1 hypothetical protein [Weissella minor]
MVKKSVTSQVIKTQNSVELAQKKLQEAEEAQRAAVNAFNQELIEQLLRQLDLPDTLTLEQNIARLGFVDEPHETQINPEEEDLHEHQ